MATHLLDTHVVLWILEDNPKVSDQARTLIRSLDNKCMVSVVSLYEIAIKKNIGKLDTSNSIHTFANEIANIGLDILPIKISHLDHYTSLPIIAEHKDPFDRLLIATALAESMSIISADEKLEHYHNLVEVFW